MVLVLILGCGLGWSVRLARIQRNAVAAIERAGGRVYYNWQVNPTRRGRLTRYPINRNARPRTPKWLVDRLGVDYFGDVIHVSLGPRDTDAVMAHVAALRRVEYLSLPSAMDEPLTDAGMVHLRGLTGLRVLVINSGAGVTRAGLENLIGMRRLEQLTLYGLPLTDNDLIPVGRLASLVRFHNYSPRITDVGVGHLRDLVNLQNLNLSESQVTGAGLAHLRGMTGLETLVLTGTRVETLGALGQHPALKELLLTKTPLDDAGLSAVSGLVGLQTLYLIDTRITDAGLVHLRGLNGLTRLVLNGTRVTDAGLDQISSLPRLEALSLSETGVTDAALARLAGLPTLKALTLAKTRVTDAGVATFSKAQPGVRIHRTAPTFRGAAPSARPAGRAGAAG